MSFLLQLSAEKCHPSIFHSHVFSRTCSPPSSNCWRCKKKKKKKENLRAFRHLKARSPLDGGWVWKESSETEAFPRRTNGRECRSPRDERQSRKMESAHYFGGAFTRATAIHGCSICEDARTSTKSEACSSESVRVYACFPPALRECGPVRIKLDHEAAIRFPETR